jgi:hypothetical protein
MVYRGRVETGVVVFDEKAALADGTEVSIRPVKPLSTRSGKARKPPSLAERLGPVVGMAEGLPEDLARNHDHYLYGLPKK